MKKIKRKKKERNIYTCKVLLLLASPVVILETRSSTQRHTTCPSFDVHFSSSTHITSNTGTESLLACTSVGLFPPDVSGRIQGVCLAAAPPQVHLCELSAEDLVDSQGVDNCHIQQIEDLVPLDGLSDSWIQLHHLCWKL